MDVHHHAHTSRKKWTHYLWEFLMLFLAVFCGFLAELQLEHYVDHKRELQYANTLYEDLRADSSELAGAGEELDFVIPRIDTFRKLVHEYELSELPSGTWYYYGRFGTRNIDANFQGATLQQLLSSGGLRYFKKYEVANAIARYAVVIEMLKGAFTTQNFIYNEVIKERNQLFDTYYMDPVMRRDISQSFVDSFKKRSYPLLTDQKRDFILYANTCQLRSNNMKNLRQNIAMAERRAAELLVMLRKTYHLK